MSMRQATLDLLDADLRGGYRTNSGTSLTLRQKVYSRTIQVDPTCWERFEKHIASNTITWQEFRFQDVTTANDLDTRIPSKTPGLYLFFVQPNTLVAGFPRIALYCGISNDRSSNRPVRERLKDYFRLNTIKKRENVHMMLQLYYPYVWVSYALLNWKSPKLKELETMLHEYIGPPFASQAYEPETKKARGAWDR